MLYYIISEKQKFARVEAAMSAFAAMPVNQMTAGELRPHLRTMFPPFETTTK